MPNDDECPKPLPVTASALLAGERARLGDTQVLRNILDSRGGFLYDRADFTVTDPENLSQVLLDYVRAQTILGLEVEIIKSGAMWFSINGVSIHHC
jgi:hypothetical protein